MQRNIIYFDQGTEAFYSGLNLDDNPYNEGTQQAHNWELGYKSAQHNESMTLILDEDDEF